MPELSVLIVAFNSEKTVLDCIESVYACSSGIDLEVLLYDNASQDDTVKKVAKRFPQVRLFQGETNLGFGPANNVLLEKSRGEYILFLNPDGILLENSLSILLDFAKSNQKAGAIGPRLCFPDGGYQIAAAEFPSLKNEFITKLHYRALDRKIKSVVKYLENRHKEATQVPWVGGACLLAARKKLVQIGGFDSNFFLYFEDIDLCKRLAQQGWKNYHLPQSVVKHLSGYSMARIPWVKELEYRKSQLYYYRKHLGRGSFILLRLYLRLKFGSQWLFMSIKKILQTGSVTAEQADFYRTLFRVISQSKYRD